MTEMRKTTELCWVVAPMVLYTLPETHVPKSEWLSKRFRRNITSELTLVLPLKQNELPHSFQLEKFISSHRVVGLFFICGQILIESVSK